MFAKGDIPSILASLSPDAEFVFCDPAYPPPAVMHALPWAGYFKGVQGVGQFFTLLDRYQECKLSIRSVTPLAGKPNEALAILLVSSKMKDTKKSGTFSAVEHWVFEDATCDKVLRISDWTDTYSVQRVLGVEGGLVRLTKEIYNAFDRGDIPNMFEVFSDDCEFHVGDPNRYSTAKSSDDLPKLAWLGIHKGKENIRKFFGILQRVAEWNLEIVNCAEGINNTTIASINITAKPRNNAPGGTYRTNMMWTFDKAGKAVRLDETFDTVFVEKMFGLIPTTMRTGTETVSSVVTAIYDAFSRGDIPTILSHCSENIQLNVCDPNNPDKSSSVPMVGVWKGHKGMLDFFKTMQTNAEVRLESECIAEKDNKVIAVNNIYVKSKQTEKDCTLRSIHYWTIGENMKAVDVQETFDTRYVERIFEGNNNYKKE